MSERRIFVTYTHISESEYVRPDHLFICHSEEELAGIAASILAASEGRRMVCLYGDMGAGKTTLVRAFAALLGATDEVSSPTFALVQEYTAPALVPPLVRHIDAYRLEHPDEVIATGIPELLDGTVWTFVEWPEILEAWLPASYVAVHIKNVSPNTREIVYLIV
jgi:tRNA threonylcarbamoyladenosine biosynthesis protein TsaE